MTLIRPTIFDFAKTKKFPSYGSFARASTGTYVDARGLIKQASVNQPRFDHDPVTGECKGLLVEESRTNLLTYSEDLTQNAPWITTAVTIAGASTTAPSGLATACKIQETSGTATRNLRRTVTFSAGATLTFSGYFKAAEVSSGIIISLSGTNGNFGATLNLSAGTSTLGSGGSYTSPSTTITAVGNGWYRVSVTITTVTDTSAILYFWLGNANSYAGTAGNGFYAWGCQLEVSAFPTSYIPTTTASVIRATDLATVYLNRLLFNTMEGSLLVKARTPFYDGYMLFAMTDGSNANEIAVYALSSSVLSYFEGRAANANIWAYNPGFSYTLGSRRSLGLSWKAGTQLFVANGASYTSSSSATIPSGLTKLDIGHRNGGANGTHVIESLAYHPRALSSAELIALTA